MMAQLFSSRIVNYVGLLPHTLLLVCSLSALDELQSVLSRQLKTCNLVNAVENGNLKVAQSQ